MALTRFGQMAQIRCRDAGPARMLRQAALNRGLTCRFHERVLCAGPDLLLVHQRFVVFNDGCFSGGCPEHYGRPRSRDAYWAERLRSIVERDRRQTLVLGAPGGVRSGSGSTRCARPWRPWWSVRSPVGLRSPLRGGSLPLLSWIQKPVSNARASSTVAIRRGARGD